MEEDRTTTKLVQSPALTSLKEAGNQSEDELDRLLEESLAPNEGYLEEWQVLTHIFKAFIGTGILGLPSAVMHGGLVFGPTILLFLGFVCMYNIKLLVDTAKNLRENLEVEHMSYSTISCHLFGSYGKNVGRVAKYVTDSLLCSLQIGFCCVYVVFIAHNLQAAAGFWDVRIWMILLFPFILVPSLVSNIRKLAYFTTFGNIIALVGLGIIYEYLATHLQDPRELPKTNGFINACVAFGQIVYAFEGIAVILPTENRLKSRKSFNSILKIAAVLVLALYATVGFLGYLTFGQNTLGSITLNLPQNKLYQGLQLAFSLMVFFTYPLQLLVSVEIIKSYIDTFRVASDNIKVEEVIIRITLVIFTCMFAIFIPQLDNFMALVGSVCGVAVGLILPPTLHALCYWNQGLTKFDLIIDFSIILIGVFAFVTGTTSTVYAIMHRYIEYPHSTKPLHAVVEQL